MRYLRLYLLLATCALPCIAVSQTGTYHLHNEASAITMTFDKLLVAAPDAGSVALTVALKSKAAGEYVIKEFETQTGVPNAGGVIPNGSTLSFSLWMRKTASVGTVFPRAKIRLNNATGTLFCTATGTTALTTTVTNQIFTCTTTANITMSATDRFYLWVGVNLTGTSSNTFNGELDIEGTLNGNFDSQVTLPLATGVPTISSLTPSAGAVNSSIVIAGTNFRSVPLSGSTVKFNGTATTPSTWSATSITAPVPTGLAIGNAPVTVTVGGQSSASANFAVSGNPGITSLTPNTGAIGSSIIIAGTNFNTQGAGSQVTFNGIAATITNWTTSSVTATVPAGATSGNVVVTAAGGVASAGSPFTVVPIPSIASLTPNTGAIGSSITFAGANFNTQGAGSQVTFNGTPATVAAWSTSSITATVPNGTTTGNVVVTAAGGISSTGNPFTVVPAPAITSLTPSSGAIGSSVTIAGTNFNTQGAGSQVTFNGTPATSTNWTTGSITATVPTGATTGNVVITTAGGVASPGSLFTVTTGSQVFSGAVTYSYDELGRLVGVVASSGDAAKYTYDAVGNILSITRYAANQSVVFAFSPKSGPIGTNVTVSGSNFSPNTTQDSVAFNGTNSSVLSASATTLVVSVPSGATTGPLTVTSPAGSVITSDSFTVTTSDGMPRIDSFAPQIVAAGASVTISGANFDPVPVNDRLIVNATPGLTPSTATATSLTLAAPAATGSGRISLNTPNGTVTASGDLFIPPANISSLYQVSNVGFTGRTIPGSSATVPISTSGKFGLLLFDGSKGQMVSAVANSGGTFSSCIMFIVSPASLFLPDSRNNSSSAQGPCLSLGGLLDSQTLPASGTYALLIAPTSPATGQTTVTPYVFSDIFSTLTVGGSPFSLTTTVPAQNGRFMFMGTPGQHVTITSSGSTFSSCTVWLRDPSGSAIVSNSACQIGQTFADLGILKFHELYTLIVDPAGPGTGSVTFQLNDATDFSAPITPGGAPVTATTTVPGQNIRLTFAGTAGQNISAFLDNSTFQGNVAFSLLDPTGAVLFSGSTSSSHGNGFLDPAITCVFGSWLYPCGDRSLPVNGTYTVLIDPAGTDVGTIRATLYNVPADQSASGVLGGAPVPIVLSTPGQNARISFTGTQNHKFSLTVTGSTFAGTFSAGCTLSIIEPNGALLAGNVNCLASSTFVDAGPLPLSGNYTIVVDLLGNTTGNASVQIYDSSDLNSNIAADGSSNVVTTNAPGQNAYLNFSGTSGQPIFAVISNISGYTGLNFTFASLTKGASHTTQIFAVQDGSTFSICTGVGIFPCEAYVLAATDTYSILLNPNGADVGSATVTLYTVPADFSGTTDTAGTPVAVATTPGQNAQLTFSANSGQSVTVNLSSGTYSAGHCQLSITRPDGGTVDSRRDCSGTSQTYGPYPLTLTGTYTIAINPQYAASGGANVAVTAH